MTRTTRTIVALIVVLSTVYGVQTASAASCSTVAKCRPSIAWNHQVVTVLNGRLAIANDRAAGGRTAPVCHKLVDCQRVQRQQVHSRIWAEGAWQRLKVDESPAGLDRDINYIWHQCGSENEARGHLVVRWESHRNHLSVNAAGDTGSWQFELPAHPDITVAEAESNWWSTMRAERDSDCGRVMSPEWSSVADHGYWWA